MGRPKGKLNHGWYGYKTGCRCKVCKRANTDHLRAWRAKKKEALALTRAGTDEGK